MLTSKQTLLAISVSLAIQSTAFASPQQNGNTLDTMYITAPATTLGQKSINAQTLDALKKTQVDTAKVLQAIPNVQVYTAGGVSALPVIRGLADDKLNIQVEGITLISACANHMNPPLSYISPSQIGEVQVFTGVAPVSVGGDNIGGSIIIKQASPQFSQNSTIKAAGEIGTFYKSNGDAFGAFVNASLANNQFFAQYLGNYNESDNYTAGKAFKRANVQSAANPQTLMSDEVASTRYKTQNHSVKLGYLQNNHAFDFTANLQKIPYQDYVNQRMDMTDNDSESYNLHYLGTYGFGDVDARVYQEDVKHSMNFGDDKVFYYPNNAQGMPMQTESKTQGINLSSTYKLSGNNFAKFGAEYQAYTLNDWWPPSGTGMMMAPNTFENIKNGERNKTSFYAELNSQINPKLQTVVGVRSDTVVTNAQNVHGYSDMYKADATKFNNQNKHKVDNLWDASLIAKYKISNTQDYEFGLARKSRAPNLYERYTWSTNGMAMRMINFAGDGNGYMGDVNIKQEVANTLSITGNWHNANHSKHLSVTPYYSYVDDFIDAKRCGANNGTTGDGCTAANLTAQNKFVYLQYANVDAQIYGVDVKGYTNVAQNTVVGDIGLKGQLSYVKGTQTSGKKDNLYNMMPLNAKLELTQEMGNFSSGIETEFVAEKDRVNAERNEHKTKGFALVNLKAGYEFNNITLNAGIDNVFDVMYYHPLGGAYLGQGRTMGGNPSMMMAPDAPDWANGTVPAMGRSLFVALSYKF